MRLRTVILGLALAGAAVGCSLQARKDAWGDFGNAVGVPAVDVNGDGVVDNKADIALRAAEKVASDPTIPGLVGTIGGIALAVAAGWAKRKYAEKAVAPPEEKK